MKIGLCLGSGGIKGFAHIGYLKIIDEYGIQISSMSGASMGALLAAFYAGGMSGIEIERLIDHLSLLDKAKLTDFFSLNDKGIIKGVSLEKFLMEKLPVRQFEDLKIPLKIVATEYRKKAETVFSTGDLIPAIHASISVPGLFQPFSYQGNLYIDGGVVNPVPFDLLDETCDFIIGVDVSGEHETMQNETPGAIEVLLSTFQIMQKIIIEQKGKAKKVKIYCKPGLVGIRSFDFHKFKEVLFAIEGDLEVFRQELDRYGLVPKLEPDSLGSYKSLS